MVDGPRGTRVEELASLIELCDTVFRANSTRSMQTDYPQLFCADNLDLCRVIAVDGRIVSHVGLVIRDVCIAGCRLRVGLIGAVATYAEHRGQGYATRLFVDAVEQTRRRGGQFMMISGNRGLYQRQHCLPVGLDWETVIRCDAISAPDIELAVCRWDADRDIETVARLHELESVRYLRPRDDWHYFTQSTVCMNRPSDLYLIEHGGEPQAYAILHRTDNPEDIVRMAEYAGDRQLLMAALPAVLDHHQSSGVTVHIGGHDAMMLRLCRDLNLPLQPAPSSGTLKIVDFAALFDAIRPHVAARCGWNAADSISVVTADDQHTFLYAEDKVALDTDTATRLVFGSHDMKVAASLGSGPCGALLRNAFPLPALWYGVNYV